MRLSAIVRAMAVRVVVMIAALFTTARQLDAQVPIILPSGSPIADLERVAASEAASVHAFVVQRVPVATDTAGQRKLSEEIAALALYSLDRQQQLFDAWRLHDTFPLAAARMRAPGDSASQAVYYAIAARDPGKVSTLVTAAGADGGSVRRNLQLLRETLEGVLVRYAGGRRATLFAKGDVKGVATGGESSAATGALGLTMDTDRSMVQASLALASTQDSLTTGFGASVLTPGSGKALSSGLLSGLFRFAPHAQLSAIIPRALHIYGTASSSRWQDTVAFEQANGTTGPARPVSANVVVLGGGALLQHDLACCRVLDNPAVLTLEWGVGFRHLGGDITAADTALVFLRDSTLGTRSRFFGGPEVGLQITVNRVIGSLQLYHFWDGRGGDVPGLTGLQMVTAFTIAADIFSGPLTR